MVSACGVSVDGELLGQLLRIPASRSVRARSRTPARRSARRGAAGCDLTPAALTWTPPTSHPMVTRDSGIIAPPLAERHRGRRRDRCRQDAVATGVPDCGSHVEIDPRRSPTYEVVGRGLISISQHVSSPSTRSTPTYPHRPGTRATASRASSHASALRGEAQRDDTPIVGEARPPRAPAARSGSARSSVHRRPAARRWPPTLHVALHKDLFRRPQGGVAGPSEPSRPAPG